jgi:hypothetical protein
LFHSGLGEEYDDDYYHDSFVVPDNKHCHFEMKGHQVFYKGKKVLGPDVYYHSFKLAKGQ